ncbi:MAG: 1-deoxy-D-xylulose-5-phosphate reductoisomerase [Endomicrobiia bacterium]
MKRVLVLGSTGSIGQNVLNIIKENRDKFEIVGLTTKSNIEILKKQIKNFSPKYVSITDEKNKISSFKTKVIYGEDGLEEIINLTKPDIVVNSVVGISGLKPLLCAIKNDVKIVALANKESIITGGEIVKKELEKHNTKLIPVDSEHSAIYQCLKNENKDSVKRIILTASGGPLFKKKNVSHSVENIINHPVWKMGKKISVDSATMINKGFEYIEAHYLFDIPYEKIDIMIHPQSLIHSLVEFKDGSILGLFSEPDMRVPISYALMYPERMILSIKRLDLTKLNSINFYKPDYKNFPLLKLVLDYAKISPSYIIAINAANEIAVDLFIHKRISFKQIGDIIKKVLKTHKQQKIFSIDDIFEIDRDTRNYVKSMFN